MKLKKFVQVLLLMTLVLAFASFNCLATTESESESEPQTETVPESNPQPKPEPKPEAWTNLPQWGLGFQYSRPCSGISVKYQIDNEIIIQPIFYVNINNNVTKQLNFGLRGLYCLPSQMNLAPYFGFALGHNEHTKNSVKKGGDGYEIFFGAEYTKYLLHPSIELALGGYDQVNSDYDAGLTINVGIMYYF
jgi:hypothetical protein